MFEVSFQRRTTRQVTYAKISFENPRERLSLSDAGTRPEMCLVHTHASRWLAPEASAFTRAAPLRVRPLVSVVPWDARPVADAIRDLDGRVAERLKLLV